MTEKLYNANSYLEQFSATVLECQLQGSHYQLVLDRTAFFPEGGGQRADVGKIDEYMVLDVHEKEGIIFHEIEQPLPVGAKVQGILTWKERFSKMQQHSGEHIVSGLIHQTYGYDNVGFHLGTDAVTMDFNGTITKEQLEQIEYRANEAVIKNIEIDVAYPSKEQLKDMEYRSKIEIDGQVRIVTILGYDCCACCAPHVRRTGEIGCIKFVGMQHYKGGIRVSMLCGFRALEDYRRKEQSVKEISVALSAKEEEIAEAVTRLKEETNRWKQEFLKEQNQRLQYKVNEIQEKEEITCFFEEQLEGNGPRELVNLALQKGATVCAVFAGEDCSGYRYVIGSRIQDIRPLSQRLNARFQGRGGGKAEMVQGSIVGTEKEIREELEKSK
ncbi:MAG: alanine--tRNA ligase-related protein [Lachnospiraceae bacterium]